MKSEGMLQKYGFKIHRIHVFILGNALEMVCTLGWNKWNRYIHKWIVNTPLMYSYLYW